MAPDSGCAKWRQPPPDCWFGPKRPVGQCVGLPACLQAGNDAFRQAAKIFHQRDA